MAKRTTRLDGGSGVNRTAGTAPAFWYNWIQVLLGAGWVHRGSGTGTSGTFQAPAGADNSNIQITNEGTGAGGIDRNNAWIVLEDPAGRRQFLLHRGTSTTAWRLYYSALDKFTGTGFGAISATVPPSATDQQQMIGSAGSFSGSWPSAGAFVCHCVAYDAPEGGGNVYPWFLFVTENGTGRGTSFVFCDALKAGSYDALDADPCIVGPVQGAGGAMMPGSASNTGIGAQFYNGSSPYIGGWYRMNLSSEAFVGLSAGIANVNLSSTYMWGNAAGLPNIGGCAPDPEDYSEPFREMIVARGGGMAGSNFVKGIPATLRWSMAGFRYADARLFQDTPDAYLYVGGALLPWPQDTPLVLL